VVQAEGEHAHGSDYKIRAATAGAPAFARAQSIGRNSQPTNTAETSFLGPLDALNHLVNLLLPAFGVGVLSAAFAKWAWRRELAGVPWRRLASWAAGAGVLTTLGGLVVFGHDGRMATYGAMLLAASLALLWVGFGSGRR
jgi:hypothetical protein